MPLIRYEIRNEHSLANPQLYKTASKDDPEGLLEGVAMAGLVGIVRQLGDLAEFAADIFRDLHEEVMATASRGHELLVRVQQLEAEMPAVEKALLSETNQLRFAYTPGAEWHASIRNDQNHCTQGDLPRFIRGSYEECRGPPRLNKLDKFDVAGAGACLKRYTDPSFFRTEWASTELMKAEKAQRDKRARREKKGRRRRNVEEKESIPVDQLHSRFNPEYSKEFVPPGADQLHPRMWQLPVADREQISGLENLNYNPSIGFKPPSEVSREHTRAGASSSSLQRLESDNSLDGPDRSEYQSSMEGLQRLDSQTSAVSRLESQASGLSRMDSLTSAVSRIESQVSGLSRMDSQTSAVSRIESQASGLSRMDSQTSMEPEQPHVREETSPRHDGLSRIRDKEAGDTYSEEGGGMSRKWEVDYSENVVERPQLSPKSLPSPHLSPHSAPSPQLSPHSPHSPRDDVKDVDEGGSDGDQFVDALATMDSEVESDSEPRARNQADAHSDRMSDAKDGSVSPQRDEVKAPSVHSRASSSEILSFREQKVQSSKKSHSRGSSGRLSSEKLDMTKIVSPPLRVHSRRRSESSGSSLSPSSSPRAVKQGQAHEEFGESHGLVSVSSFNSVSGVKVSKMVAEFEKRTLEQIQDDERREQEREEELERQRKDEQKLELQKEQERLEALQLEERRQEEFRKEQLRKEEQLQEELRKEQIRQDEVQKEQTRREEIHKEQVRKEELEREQIRQEKIRMEQSREEEFRREQARRQELRREQARLEQLRLEQIRQEDERRKEEQRQLEERQMERKQEEERQRHIKVSVYSAKKPQAEGPRAAAARQSQEEISSRTLPPPLQSSAPPTVEVEVPSPSSSPMSLSSGSPPDSPVFSAFHSLSPIRTSRNVLSSPESRPGFVSRPGYAAEMMSPTSPVPILALSMSPTSRSGSPPPPLEWPGMQVLDSPTSPSNSYNKFDVRSPSSSPKAPGARSSFHSQTEREVRSSFDSQTKPEARSSFDSQTERGARASYDSQTELEARSSFDSQTEREAISSSVSPKGAEEKSLSVTPSEPEVRFSSTSPREPEVKLSYTPLCEHEVEVPSTTLMVPERRSLSSSPEEPQERSLSSSPRRHQDRSPAITSKETAAKSPFIVLQEAEERSPIVSPKSPDIVTVVTRAQDPYPSFKPALVSQQVPEITPDSRDIQKAEVKVMVAVPQEPEVASVSPRSEESEVTESRVPATSSERPTPGRPSTSSTSSTSSSSSSSTSSSSPSSSSSDEAAEARPKLARSERPEDNPDENAPLESAPSDDSDFSPPVSPTSSIDDFSTTVAGKLLADFSSAIPSSENFQELASVSRAIFKKDLLLPQSESESEPEPSPSDPPKYTSDNPLIPGPSRLSEGFPSSSSVSYDSQALYSDVPSKADSPPRLSTEVEDLSTALVPAPPAPAPAPTTFDLDPMLKTHYELRLSPPFRKSDSSSALKPFRELPPLPPVRTERQHFSSRPLLLPPSVSDSSTAASAGSSIPPPPAPPAKSSVSFRGSPSKPAVSLTTLSLPAGRPLPNLPAPTPPTKNQGGNGEFNPAHRPLHELPQPPPPPSRPLHELPPPPFPTAKRGVAGENIQDALLEAITSHDKNQLKKVKTMQNPALRKADDRSHLLEQIRAQSFNLRHTVVEKSEPPPVRPTTNINVAAILEKANAIRQAFAGSDEDDDDEDEWSDIPRKD